jgi:hypothetical protein
MAIMDAVAEWYDAQDSGDIDRIMATLTPTGTFKDPGTGDPVSGDAVGAYFQQRNDLFTERVCTVMSSGAWSDTEAAAMLSGSLRHIESGKVITIESAESFTYDPELGKFSAVTAFYDLTQVKQQLR